jgi:hypothetical protein
VTVAVAVAIGIGVGPEAAGIAEGAMLCRCFTGGMDGVSEAGHGESSSFKSGGAGAVRGSCDRKPTAATTTAISTIIAVITCRSGCTSQGQLGQYFVRR